jgi:hypothetical protein
LLNFNRALDIVELVDRPERGSDPTVNAQDLILEDGSKGEVVKHPVNCRKDGTGVERVII